MGNRGDAIVNPLILTVKLYPLAINSSVLTIGHKRNVYNSQIEEKIYSQLSDKMRHVKPPV
ncbi:hypothetical protein J6590_018122 [Homalodisca vitripennis]|nr:hypothetical protein J6590_018122 [Homalodisca vitripennis]